MHFASCRLGIHGDCKEFPKKHCLEFSPCQPEGFLQMEIDIWIKGTGITFYTKIYQCKIVSRSAPTAFSSLPFNDWASFKGQWADYLSHEREVRRNQVWCVPYKRSSDPANTHIHFSPGDKHSYSQGLNVCRSDQTGKKHRGKQTTVEIACPSLYLQMTNGIGRRGWIGCQVYKATIKGLKQVTVKLKVWLQRVIIWIKQAFHLRR